jgi:hypothetical protein
MKPSENFDALGVLPAFDVYHRKALDDSDEEGSYSLEAMVRERRIAYHRGRLDGAAAVVEGAFFREFRKTEGLEK